MSAPLRAVIATNLRISFVNDRLAGLPAGQTPVFRGWSWFSCHAGATRCVDDGEIWRRTVDDQLVRAKFHFNSSVQCGPKKSKFYEIFGINVHKRRITWAILTTFSVFIVNAMTVLRFQFSCLHWRNEKLRGFYLGVRFPKNFQRLLVAKLCIWSKEVRELKIIRISSITMARMVVLEFRRHFQVKHVKYQHLQIIETTAWIPTKFVQW